MDLDAFEKDLICASKNGDFHRIISLLDALEKNGISYIDSKILATALVNISIYQRVNPGATTELIKHLLDRTGMSVPYQALCQVLIEFARHNNDKGINTINTFICEKNLPPFGRPLAADQDKTAALEKVGNV